MLCNSNRKTISNHLKAPITPKNQKFSQGTKAEIFGEEIDVPASGVDTSTIIKERKGHSEVYQRAKLVPPRNLRAGKRSKEGICVPNTGNAIQVSVSTLGGARKCPSFHTQTTA